MTGAAERRYDRHRRRQQHAGRSRCGAPNGSSPTCSIPRPADGEACDDSNFYLLPTVPRGTAASGAYRCVVYQPLDELRQTQPDALIVTGTSRARGDRPTSRSGRADRPGRLGGGRGAARDVLLHRGACGRVLHSTASRGCAGAKNLRASTNAHGGRRPSAARRVSAHSEVPHSRFNRVDEAALRAGRIPGARRMPGGGRRTVRAASVRQPALCCKATPNMTATIWSREYRRDIRNVISPARPHYPDMPENYFGSSQARGCSKLRAGRIGTTRYPAHGRLPRCDVRQGTDAWLARSRPCASAPTGYGYQRKRSRSSVAAMALEPGRDIPRPRSSRPRDERARRTTS